MGEWGGDEGWGWGQKWKHEMLQTSAQLMRKVYTKEKLPTKEMLPTLLSQSFPKFEVENASRVFIIIDLSTIYTLKGTS